MISYKVSLIIPCYNSEKYLDYCFNSVLNQSISMEDMEIIFVYDTLSTDDSLNILEEYKNDYSNVKLIKYDNPTNNAGLPRNEGLKHVSSPYIIFLDSDDALEKDAVEVLYNTITKYNVDIVKSNYSLLVNNEKVKLTSTSQEPIIIKPQSKDLSLIANDMVWATIYSSDFIRNNNIEFSNSILGEDTLFIATCLCKTRNDIVLLDNFYSVIYTSDNFDSHSHNVNVEKLHANINTHREIMSLLTDTNQDINYIQNCLKRFILNSISNTMRCNESRVNKKSMVDLVSDFILDYQYINVNFSFIWKILYDMFRNKRYNLILFSSYLIRLFFNSKFLSKLQLFIRKRGWHTLKDDDNNE